MTTARRLFRQISIVLTPLLLIASALVSYGPQPAGASSHREAPLIANDAPADNTDLYAFVSPDNPNTVTLVANFIPFEHPDGAPNFYRFSDDVTYEIHIDNVGDAKKHITYRFKFTTQFRDPTTFLYNTGRITAGTPASRFPGLNVIQTYTLTEIRTPISGPQTTTTLGSNLPVPPVNIGSKSTPNYDALAAVGVQTLSSGGDTIKVFAGPRDDPFWVDLGAIFDLLSLRPAPPPIGYPPGPTVGIDSVSGFNVHSLVLQVPISRLRSSQNDPVIGVWTTASRPSTRVLNDPATVLTGGADNLYSSSGAPVQISRLGMPLTNEVVLPLALKDAFNGLDPTLDAPIYLATASSPPPFNDPNVVAVGNLFEKSVMNPELGRLLCGLYGVPLPRAGTGPQRCSTSYTPKNPSTGRADLFTIFLTGIPGLNKPTKGTNGSGAGIVPAEMLRLNTALRPGSGCPSTPNYALGVLGGDSCGFPNGRRLQDDVTRISLLAVAGKAFRALTGDASFTYNTALDNVLTDGTTRNDVPFLTTFPYVASPHQGQEWDHKSLIRNFFTTVHRNSTAATEQGPR